MPRVTSLLLALLPCSGCRMLGRDDLAAWKAEHGIVDTGAPGETGLPLAPPDVLCSEAWGRVISSMDRDEDLRTVQAGSSYALMYWFEGPVDICALGCTVDWVQQPYLTSDKNYTLEEYWLDAPQRLEAGQRIYAMFYLQPDATETPGEQGECQVETSAGTRSFPVAIMET